MSLLLYTLVYPFIFPVHTRLMYVSQCHGQTISLSFFKKLLFFNVYLSHVYIHGMKVSNKCPFNYIYDCGSSFTWWYFKVYDKIIWNKNMALFFLILFFFRVQLCIIMILKNFHFFFLFLNLSLTLNYLTFKRSWVVNFFILFKQFYACFILLNFVLEDMMKN